MKSQSLQSLINQSNKKDVPILDLNFMNIQEKNNVKIDE
jgi:hypothetical protein